MADLLFRGCSFYIPVVRPEWHFGTQDEYILHLQLCQSMSSILYIDMLLLVCSSKGWDPFRCSFDWGQCVPLWANQMVRGQGNVDIIIIIIIIVIIIIMIVTIISVISRIWFDQGSILNFSASLPHPPHDSTHPPPSQRINEHYHNELIFPIKILYCSFQA